MARRGPSRKPKGTTKEALFSMRMRDELKTRLQKSAGKRGISLGEEINQRLNELFEIAEKFGGAKSFAFFKRLAKVLEEIERQTQCRWRQDRYTFDQVKAAFLLALDLVKPKLPLAMPLGFQPYFRTLEEFEKSKVYRLGENLALLNFAELEKVADAENFDDRLVTPETKNHAHLLGADLTKSPSKILKSKRRGSKR